LETTVFATNWPERLSHVGIISVVAAGLYLTSLYSYLLFHTLVELITIAIGFSLFILAWNTRRFHASNYLNLLGISYAFIAAIDLIHTLAYRGMGIFAGYGANLPTQLWIGARYLQALTLCAAPLVAERRQDNRVIVALYAVVAFLLVGLIFSGNFPDCYLDGQGLTPFKVGSEYAIVLLLLLSLVLLHRIRRLFRPSVYLFIVTSVACTALSELLFTAYLSVYGFANMTGHLLKFASYYLLYRALLVTGLKEPFNLIFRGVGQSDELVRKVLGTLEQQGKESGDRERLP
jgi:hypothetical protein